jgi:6-phospho-3-hexuloisomerase
MPIKRTVNQILAEMERTLSQVSPDGLEQLAEAVLAADRIYVAGGGRSGLIARAFAMRLMHLGRITYVVGETTTPSIHRGDLLVSCSAGGETGVTITVSEVAKKAGARVFAITATPGSPMARLADETIVVPAPTKHTLPGAGGSSQYGGSLFEQSLLVLLDATASEIGRRLGTPTQDIDARHANLE